MSHQPKKTRRPIQFPHTYMPKYTIPLRYLCLTFWRYAYVVCRYVCWHISSKRWTLQFLADQPPKLWTAGTDDGSPLKKQFDINCIESKNLLCAKSGNPSPPPRAPSSRRAWSSTLLGKTSWKAMQTSHQSQRNTTPKVLLLLQVASKI